jgi:hypothetical protein
MWIDLIWSLWVTGQTFDQDKFWWFVFGILPWFRSSKYAAELMRKRQEVVRKVEG